MQFTNMPLAIPSHYGPTLGRRGDFWLLHSKGELASNI
jgi:hypothetical protein